MESKKTTGRPALIILILSIFLGGQFFYSNSYASSGKDIIIKTQLLTTYELNPKLNQYPIEVSVNQGIVILHGSVKTTVDKLLAEQIAQLITGVKKLTDNIRVMPNLSKTVSTASFGQRVTDLTTTAMIMENLQNEPSLSSSVVHLVTSGGFVTLSGTVVTSEQKTLAEHIATQTPGVKQVVNNVQVAS